MPMTKFRAGNISRAKLTPEDVVEIRRRYNALETQGALARAYGVSIGTIGRIVRGESWTAYQQPQHPLEVSHEAAMEQIITDSAPPTDDVAIQASIALTQSLIADNAPAGPTRFDELMDNMPPPTATSAATTERKPSRRICTANDIAKKLKLNTLELMGMQAKPGFPQAHQAVNGTEFWYRDELVAAKIIPDDDE